MIDFELLKKTILDNHSFLLTTHVNPDADAIGSETAFYFMLKELGKEVHIINHSDIPYNLIFLDPDNRVEKFNYDRHSDLFNQADVLVALDFNRSERMVKVRKLFIDSEKLKICIDHHEDPEDFVDQMFVDTSYAATGHIIYDLIKKTGIVKLNYQIAYCLYAAIMTDTGSFRFEKTTPELHRIIAELLEQNVSPIEVYDKIYDQSLFSKIKLLGKALETIKLYGEKKQIAYMVLTAEMFKETEAVESDTDNFVNYSLSIEFVRMGLMFIQLREGFKVSFRSKGLIPVNKLAAEFGGGGHANASGARIFTSKLEEMLPVILKRAEDYLEQYG